MSDRLWIMIDIETSGPIIGRHSMTELGAAVGSRTKGTLDTFEVLIKPISDEVKTSKDSFAAATERGLPPAEAMKKFADWCAPHIAQRATFIARPSCFDWPWIVWYAWTYLNDNPFGFRALCASSWFEARGKKFSVELPHIAVEDAKIQLAHFFSQG
jgi:ribonuclease T